MFGAVHLHRSTEGECGSDGVRAAGALVPGRSSFEPDRPGPFHRRRVADRLEDYPRGIGEDHEGPRLRQEVSGLFRDRRTRPDQVTMRVLKRPESLFHKRHRRLRAPRIHSRGGTALPRPFDHIPDGMRRQVTATQELLPGRHHPPFLIRMRESRERFLRCHLASPEGLRRDVRRLDGACQAEQQQMIARFGKSFSVPLFSLPELRPPGLACPRAGVGSPRARYTR